MAPSSSTDKRYLEQKNGKWRVTIAVPRDLHSALGTRLKRSLHTDSLALANQLKWPVVGELRAMIDEARAHQAGGGSPAKDALVREAMEVSSLRARARSAEEVADIDDAITLRAEEIVGKPIRIDDYPAPIGEVRTFEPERQKRAHDYVAIARGDATPIALYHKQYLAQSTTKARTQADDRRAIRYLLAWCERERVQPALQAITRKAATRFMDNLGTIANGQSPVTLQKYIYRLSRYWQWLAQREHVEMNVWSDLKIAAPDTPHDQRERPFTTDEVLALLEGPASPAMHDLMRIAALTGARLDVIVDLRVKDCRDGVFMFKPQKREGAARAVPIHSDLRAIVEGRTEGKAAEDDVFPEWPAPKKSGSHRERSFKASNAFTTYRRSVGVEEQVQGKRRSLVNFHSFRRWFITQAEQADQPEHIIAAVVGHTRKGMTLGRYSAGPLIEQARRCVEAVRLPKRTP